jgi:hypothetical protein
MRLEGEGGGGPVERPGAAACRRDHGAVAAMHAIEISDGNDRAGKRRRERRIAMNDGERWRRLRDFAHRVRFGAGAALIAGEMADVARSRALRSGSRK